MRLRLASEGGVVWAAAVPSAHMMRRPQSLAFDRGLNRQGLSNPVLIIGVAWLLIFVFYSDTIASAVALWAGNAAYSHGFVILPIALYLMYERREKLHGLRAEPSFLGLGFLLAAGAFWAFGRAAGIQEAEHLAVVGLLQASVYAIAGGAIFWRLIFPLAYLLLLVPTGSFLLPALQGIATALSSLLLKLSGIPIFVSGTTIEAPYGLYEIAPGCAGLNFVLASLALGPLYVASVYQGLGKRFVALGVLLIVAVFANGFRIFGIIALAEATGLQIDLVDDHLLFGWGFFVVVLALLGWLGLRFADPARPFRSAFGGFSRGRARGGSLFLVALALMGTVLFPAAQAFMLGQSQTGPLAVALTPPPPGWQVTEANSLWQIQADEQAGVALVREGEAPTRAQPLDLPLDVPLDITVALFAFERAGFEASAGNLLTQLGEPAFNTWRLEDRSVVFLAGVPFERLRLSDLGQTRVVYVTAKREGAFAVSREEEIRQRLRQNRRVSDRRAALIVLTVMGGEEQSALSPDKAAEEYLLASGLLERVLAE